MMASMASRRSAGSFDAVAAMMDLRVVGKLMPIGTRIDGYLEGKHKYVTARRLIEVSVRGDASAGG